jgi:hypothetical protein
LNSDSLFREGGPFGFGGMAACRSLLFIRKVT